MTAYERREQLRKETVSNLRHNIKMIRTERQLTIAELAERADIGSSTLKEIIRGKQDNPEFGTLCAIAAGLDITLSDLFKPGKYQFLE